MFYLLAAAAGMALGFLLTWLHSRAATERLLERLAAKEREIAALQAQFPTAFRSLSQDVLRANSDQFLQLAQETMARFQTGAVHDLTARQTAIQQIVKPLSDSLQLFGTRIQELENNRTSAYSQLTEQVKQIVVTNEDLRRETGKLASALRSPSARGRWGEIQLRRVVELAGMLEYCDFHEQPVTSNGSGDGSLRPDLLIRLPNERQIVIDAKAPMQAYLEALECTDEKARLAKLSEHAAHIRRHLKKLGEKSYWAQFESSPEFVIAFLPGEIFFSAAVQQDPELIEYGVQNRVMLATPTTLIALLKAVAYGWNHEKLARNAQEIRSLGMQMYDRIRKFAEHYEDVGKSLENAQNAFEKGRRSMETRLLATARKLEDLGAAPANSGALPAVLSFGIDDESGSDPGRSREAAGAGR